MKLGFYYHKAVVIKNNDIYVPSYIGVFLDGLSEYVEELVIFFHKPKDEKEMKECDYKLKNKNIKVIVLQKRQHMFLRGFLAYKEYFKILKQLKLLDVIVIRTPTPLLNFFYKSAIKSKTKVCLYIVGDYLDNFKPIYSQNKVSIKNNLLLVYYYFFNKKLNKIINKSTNILITNNKYILNNLKKIAKNNIYFIPSTTLTKKDFINEERKFCFDPVKLLYVGRIEESKGLDVLIKSLKILKNRGINNELNIVGWDPSGKQKTILKLKQLIDDLNINNVKFHGRKKAGKELHSFYKNNDILIVPTKGNEGFPRVIWEAFSQKIPVIATNVGGIPFILEHKVHALLVKPNNATEIAESIISLKNDKQLLFNLIKNGYELALMNTIEKRSYEFIQILKRRVNDQKNF